MNERKVSIVIPVYNGENYIEEAINSALNQTYPNIEVLVVNDGSTDETESIVKQYGDKVRYLKKENGGVSSALNLGIRKMKGEYFSWLSHDDIYYPNKIEEQMRMVNENPENNKFVYSDFDLLDAASMEKKSRFSLHKKYLDKCEIAIFPALFNIVNGCTVLIHKSIFDAIGMFDETLVTAQDCDMWFRILRHVRPIYVKKRLVSIRLHETQGTKTISRFMDNWQEQQMSMINALSNEEIDSVFGGEYKFLADMIELGIQCGWDKCVSELCDTFTKLRQPDLCTYSNLIYLYGAGVNGKKVLKDCVCRGVKVAALIDQNSELWGKTIDGVECVSIDNVPKTSEVWITIEESERIADYLKEKGFIVKDISDTESSLFNMLPFKDKLCERVYNYLNQR